MPRTQQPITAPDFANIVERRWSRREWLALLGGAAASLTATAAAPGAARTSRSASVASSIVPSTFDGITLPHGYRYDLLARWGDALFPGAESLDIRQLARGPLLRPGAADAQLRQFGTHCDAVGYFPLEPDRAARASRGGILCVNNEYVSIEQCFAGVPADDGERARQRRAWTEANPQAVRWMQAAQGVSIFRVERGLRGWRLVRDARYSRRISALTPCDIYGPARGHAWLRDASDREGTRALGTFANCAAGKTPWGTYLTTEENVQDYFGGYRTWLAGADDALPAKALARFDMMEKSLYGWEYVDPRFDLRRTPAEPLRFGWIVEIDPRNPEKPPRKRTALGRFMHEAANTILAADGRVVVYMGDDDKFEYVYKFVSRERFMLDRTTMDSNLLDDGVLYAARFDADGTGAWLPLRYDPNGLLNERSGFADQGEVVMRARAAADLLGATPMDRPEDIEPHPITGRVYIACTKNSDRTAEPTRRNFTGREIDMGVDAANPRAGNRFGHVIELIETGDDAAASAFRWNLLLLAGRVDANGSKHLVNVDELAPGRIASGDTFSAGKPLVAPTAIACPDNLGIDPAGRLWVVTDHDIDGMPNNGCFVVPVVGPQRGELKQIVSAPRGAEICGCEFTPDGATLFLSIQHPGEGGSVDAPTSHWPDGGALPPRSALIAVRRDDGEPV